MGTLLILILIGLTVQCQGDGCTCTCPSSVACPVQCNSCTMSNVGCTCNTPCQWSSTCTTGYTYTNKNTNTGCWNQRSYECRRNDCSYSTTTCQDCKWGYYGNVCQNQCQPNASNPCNGRGSCSMGFTGNGACTCYVPWKGNLCQYSDQSTCNGYGTVSPTGVCTCKTAQSPPAPPNTIQYTGANCQNCSANFYNYPNCIYCTKAATCSNHGSCSDTGSCICDPGFNTPDCKNCLPNYYGPNCQYCVASDTCYGRGSCAPGGGCQCSYSNMVPNCSTCVNNRFGNSCSGTCPNCANGGTCNQGWSGNGQCSCPPGTAGATCQYTDAATCKGHGTAQNDGSCVCNAAWSGPTCNACATGYFPNGPNCTYCVASVTCTNQGNCTATGTCTCKVVGMAQPDCSTCKQDYYAWPTCRSCTNASCNNKGVCDTLGFCVCNDGFDGTTCNVCKSGRYGPNCLPCPGGEQTPCNGQGTCFATITGNGTCKCTPPFTGVDCNEPTITNVTPSVIPTFGTIITITGQSFGTNGTIYVVANTTLICTPTPPNLGYSASYITCTVPPGQPPTGKNNIIGVQVNRGSDANSSKIYNITYKAPQITSIDPPNAPSVGGALLTLVGSDFGINGSVKWGSTIIPSVSYTGHNKITINAPHGFGPISVAVIVSGNTSNSVPFNYDLPSITSVTPSGTTAGNYQLIVQGVNFGVPAPVGTDQPYTFTLGGVPCPGLTPQTDGQFFCNAPAGSGIVVAKFTNSIGQSVNVSYSYLGPQISGVSGCTDSGNSTTACPAKGGINIIVYGSNFGPAATGAGGNLIVTVGGAVCGNLTMVIPNTNITCTLPVGAGLGAAVTVSRGGVQNSTVYLLSYKSPMITAKTLRLKTGVVVSYNGSSPNSFVNASSTLGGEEVFFSGLYFGNSTANITVYYGPPDDPNRYTCSNITSLNDTNLTCILVSGVGRGLHFKVVVSGVASLPSIDDVNYPPPIITPNSLTFNKFGGPGQGTNALQSSTTQGDNIVFSGFNFGGLSLVTVTYGLITDVPPYSTYGCFPQIGTNDNYIYCQTTPGEGATFRFSVTVGSGMSAQTALGNDTYSYPVAPIIIMVSGCSTGPNNSTIDCPTEGVDSNGQQVRLTISGSDFSENSTVTVNGNLCQDPKKTNDPAWPSQISCILPPGSGLGLLVSIQSGRLASRPKFLVSYAAPTISNVRGCVDNGNNTVDCPRNATRQITVTGANFGPNFATVLVGGSPCQNPVQDTTYPHRIVYCNITGGTGVGRAVLLLQSQGSISQSSVYVSFFQCPPGQYALINDRICRNCSAGYFTSQIAQQQCLNCSKGQYSDVNGLSTCLKCDPGYYAADPGATRCRACTAGKFATSPGSVGCDDCLPGSASGNGSASCDLCDSGSFQGQAAQSTCDLCDEGQVAAFNGLTTCTVCDAGKYAPNQGLTSCQLCPLGKISNGDYSGCTNCSLGTYASVAGQTDCFTCPPGRYSDISGVVACQQCPFGTYTNASGASQCTNCPSGQFAAAVALSACQQCASGFYNNDTAVSTCQVCEPGYAQNSQGQSGCNSCVPGLFVSSPGQIQCEPCQPGRFSNVSALAECFDCPEGKRSSIGETQCTLCEIGKYGAVSGLADCAVCTAGQYQNNSGQSDCMECDPGYYQESPGSSSCDPCQDGDYSLGSAISCEHCSPGWWSNDTSSLCNPCEKGRYQGSEGASSCIDCEIGFSGPSQALSACTLCTSGTFANDTGLQECYDCPSGKYSENDPGATGGQTGCLDCLAGYYTSGTQQSQCFPCPAGTAAALPGQTQCAPCLAGTYQDQNAQTFCFNCSLGKYVNTNGSAECLPCDLGRYANSTGSTDCIDCAAGTVAQVLNSVSCRACDPGYFCPLQRQASCTLCNIGTFTNTSGATTWSDCDEGYVQPNQGATVCTICDIGKYASGTTQCVACNLGTFTNNTGTTQCFRCEPGFYADIEGSDMCKPCHPGYYSNRNQTVTCFPCQPPQISNTTGETTCITCGAGYYQDQPAQSSCNYCPSGTFSKENPIQCTPCKAGKYSVQINQTIITDCEPCLPGSFQANAGASSCNLCPPGQYINAQNPTGCLECSAGTATNYYGNTSCSDCPRGYFQDQPGQSECVVCPRGTFSSVTKLSTVCSPCLPGWYAPNTTNAKCFPCEVGKYQAESGNSFCSDCPVGTITDSTAQSTCKSCEPGTYAPISGLGGCTKCEPGTYQNTPAKGNCYNCSAGTVAEKIESTVCNPCKAGTYSLNSASVCVDCTKGKYQDKDGQSSCLQCNPGSTSVNRATSCTQCPARSVAPFYGSEQCFPCDEHAESDSSYTSCICGPGYYATPKVSGNSSIQNGNNSILAFICAPCPAGALCDEKGVTYLNMQTRQGWWRSSRSEFVFYRCLLPSQCLGGLNSTCGENREGPLCANCLPGYRSANGVSACNLCPQRQTSIGVSIILCILFILALIFVYYLLLRFDRELLRKVAEDHSQTLQYVRESNNPAVSGMKKGFGKLGLNRREYISSPSSSAWALPEHQKERLSVDSTGLSDSARSKGDLDHIERGPLPPPPPPGAPPPPPDGEPEDDYEPSTVQQDSPAKAPESNPIPSTVIDNEPLPSNEVENSKIQSQVQDIRTLKFDDFQDPVFTNSAVFTATKAQKNTPLYKMKILISFLQITYNLAFILDVPWPTYYRQFMSAFSFINLEFIPWQSVGCATQFNYYEKFLIITITPFVLLVGVFFLFVLPLYWYETKYAMDQLEAHMGRKKVRRIMWKLVLFTLFLLYPGVSADVLGMLVCRPINGVYYLAADFSIHCGDPEWLRFIGPTVVMILIYPIGVPLFFFVMLWRYRYRLEEAGVQLQLGFLYAGYNIDMWWFEMVDMANKLILTSVLAFFPFNLQMQFGMAFICIYCIIILLCQPYISTGDDRLALAANVEISLVIMAGYILNTEGKQQLDPLIDILLSVLFITITIMIMIAFLIMSAKSIYKWLKQNRGDDLERLKKHLKISGGSSATSLPVGARSSVSSVAGDLTKEEREAQASGLDRA